MAQICHNICNTLQILKYLKISSFVKFLAYGQGYCQAAVYTSSLTSVTQKPPKQCLSIIQSPHSDDAWLYNWHNKIVLSLPAYVANAIQRAICFVLERALVVYFFRLRLTLNGLNHYVKKNTDYFSNSKWYFMRKMNEKSLKQKSRKCKLKLKVVYMYVHVHNIMYHRVGRLYKQGWPRYAIIYAIHYKYSNISK